MRQDNNISPCTHVGCNKVYPDGSPTCKGVGLLIVQRQHNGREYALAGYERGGRYADQLNLIGGKRDPTKRGYVCIHQAAVDELCQEAKICIHADRYNHTGVDWTVWKGVKSVYKQKTRIFLIHAVNESICRLVNPVIKQHNADRTLPDCEHEMAYITWCDVNTPGTSDYFTGVIGAHMQTALLEQPIKLSRYVR